MTDTYPYQSIIHGRSWQDLVFPSCPTTFVGYALESALCKKEVAAVITREAKKTGALFFKRGAPVRSRQ